MAIKLSEKLKDFPCSFNLSLGSKISLQRLKYAEQNLKADLKAEYVSSVEKVRNLNLLSWVMFKLGDLTEATKFNERALQSSEQNLTALGNEIFITYERGDQIKAEKLLHELKYMNERPTIERLKVAARAEQAYSYIKLNMMPCYNLSKSTLLDCIEVFPYNYLWKLDLGLLRARCLHYNVKFSCVDIADETDQLSKCVSLLLDVADKGDNDLKGLAYAELARLRQSSYWPEMDNIFNGLSVLQLTTESLRFGSNNPAVLSQCGKSLRNYNLDEAINLLRRSIQLKPTSKAYGHLGNCLVKKAELISCGKYRAKTSSDELTPKRHRKQFGNRNKRIISTKFSSAQRLDSNEQLRRYATQDLIPLNASDALVNEAFECYKKSLLCSLDENEATRLSLAQLHFKVGSYEAALTELNRIIDKFDVEFTYLVTLILAQDLAGECLLKLNKATSNCNNNLKPLEEAQKYTIHMVSLSAGLASTFPEHKNCAIEVWSSFKNLLQEIKEIPSSLDKNQQLMNLIGLAVNHDIFHEIEDIVKKSSVLKDAEISQRVIKHLLEKGQHEDALTYLNIVNCVTSVRQGSSIILKLLELQSRVYTRQLNERSLNEDSEGFKLLFQQMFHLKYGQCLGRRNRTDENVEQGNTKQGDVLVVHCGSEDKVTGQVALNLSQVIDSVFGLKVSIGAQGENDSLKYNQMLKTAILSDVTHAVVINFRQTKSRPGGLKQSAFLNFRDRFWQKTKLVTNRDEDFGACINGLDDKASSMKLVDTVFNVDKEAVMKLFCCLVDERFKNIPGPVRVKLFKRMTLVDDMTTDSHKKKKLN
ncbi:hypothetical protein Btru_070758 [Bulinus truncatus]|nr:hypothetical protein Btru_070758 [Bulinus truncatus]